MKIKKINWKINFILITNNYNYNKYNFDDINFGNFSYVIIKV